MLVLMGFGCGGVSLDCRQPSGCWCPSSTFGTFLIVLCMSAQGDCLVAECTDACRGGCALQVLWYGLVSWML